MDKVAELASNGEYGEMILPCLVIFLGFVLSLFGGLVKRAIKTVDDKIEDNKHEVQKLRSEVEVKFEQVADSLKTLTETSFTNTVQNKEDIGEIKSNIAYIKGYLESKAQEEKSIARNRRVNDN